MREYLLHFIECMLYKAIRLALSGEMSAGLPAL